MQQNSVVAESVFIMQSDKATYRARFLYAAEKEVAECGYGTIVAFHLMVEQKLVTFIADTL